MATVKIDPIAISENARISFVLGGIWVMEINNLGIFFNREAYPHLDEKGFAAKVIEILEKTEYVVNPDKLK